MTDMASLTMAVDARQVDGAVDSLNMLGKASAAAEGQVNSAGKTWVRASSEAGRLRMAAGEAGAALQRVTASAGAQRAGMQQLSYQIGDVAQQFALGVNPMTIFAQQGGQVVQALNMMRGSAGGLIGFLGGPWGAVIMGAATVAGMFASRLFDSGDAAETAAGKYRTAAAEARELAKAMEGLALVDRQIALNKTRDELFRSELAMDRLPQRGWFSNFLTGIGRGGVTDDTIRQGLDARIWQLRQRIAAESNIIGLAGRENESAAGRSAVRGGGGGGGGRGRAEALSEEQRAAEAALKAARDYANGIVEETEKIGLNARQIKEMEFAKRAATAETAAALAPTQKLRDELLGQADAIRKNAAAWGARTDKMEAAAKAQADAFKHVQDTIDGWGDEQKAAADAIDQMNGKLRDTISLIDSMGGRGLGDIASVLYGIQTGDFSGARGRVGGIVAMVNELSGGALTYEKMSKSFKDALAPIFGENGEKLQKMLQGGALGSAFGSLFFGQNNNAGSMIGGMMGQAFFTASKGIGSTLGKKLGSFAGSVGVLVGSLLGGLLGGLFSKTKTGSASLGQGAYGLTISGISGTNDERKQAATSMATGLINTLDDIAAALGVTATGPVGVSIGIRKKKYVVDTTGMGRTKGAGVLEFGEDQAAALKYALTDAIGDGVLFGLRESTKRLLQTGDIERQLKKALKFQDVFAQLAQETDPLAYALEQINKGFNEMTLIFKEAGASVEEYADLERLLGIQRAKAYREAASEKLGLEARILALLGQDQDALAASRLLELSGMRAGLQPLQALIYQLSDARDVIDQFRPLADDLRRYRAELLGGQAAGGFGFLQAQFRSTAALAMGGDAAAMAQLRGVSDDYLAAARGRARSTLEYQRMVGEVLASVDKSIWAAEQKVDYAQLQIDAIRNTNDIIASMREEFTTFLSTLALNSNGVIDMLKRFDIDGLTVRTNSDSPLAVTP